MCITHTRKQGREMKKKQALSTCPSFGSVTLHEVTLATLTGTLHAPLCHMQETSFSMMLTHALLTGIMHYFSISETTSKQ